MKVKNPDAGFFPPNDTKHKWGTFVLFCASSWDAPLYVSELQSRWKDAVIVGGIAATGTRSSLNFIKQNSLNTFQ
jgi:hypothetical protein